MQDYGVHDYGLLLQDEDMREISKRMFDDYTDEAWENDKWGFIEEVWSKLGITYISDFTGEALPISDGGFSEWFGESVYDSDWIFYMPARKIPTLLRAAYRDMDELMEEFRSALQKYLPQDFSYRNRVREIVGTYYG